jgi:DNA-binding IclR family transcriptional regulator
VSEDKNAGSMQVLSKVAGLLDLLAERGELTAAEIAELSHEPRSSIYRLLASLQSLDLVESGNRRGTSRLGLGLLRLGAAVIARFDERQAALPAMEVLHETTGETVFLCVRRGFEAVCVERLDGERVQSLALKLGGSLPLHAGAAPRVLLAFEPEEMWDEYLRSRKLTAFTRNTPVTRKRLVEELRRTRDQGYAVSDQDVTLGIAAFGAPVFDYEGHLRAALSISGVRPVILDDAKHLVDLTIQAARQASRALGNTDQAPPKVQTRSRASRMGGRTVH